MTFVAGAIIWAAYTIGWWGWQAVTDRVPPGPQDQFHWPSIRDLVTPGRGSFGARPPATSGSTLNQQAAQILQAGGEPIPYTPTPVTGQFGQVPGGLDTGNILTG